MTHGHAATSWRTPLLLVALLSMVTRAPFLSAQVAQDLAPDLGGTSWQLVKFQGSDRTAMIVSHWPYVRSYTMRRGHLNGVWELCEGESFKGRCITLDESVPDLSALGMRVVRSVRPVRA